MNIKLFFILFFFYNTAQSQLVHKTTVYFLQNSDEINWDGEHALDSIFNLIVNKKMFYNVEIIGTADRTGSKSRNLVISQQRADKVKGYFLKYGFSEERIISVGTGVSNMAGDGEQKEERRVEIEISLNVPSLNLELKNSNDFEKFTIDNRYGGNLLSNSGAYLFFPSDGFMDKDGNDITGQIRIEYKEYSNYWDFIKKAIPMNNIDHKLLLNSTGMFEIRAFYCDIPLKMKPNRQFSVMFGLNKRLPLLDLYLHSDSLKTWDFKKHITNQHGKLDASQRYSPGCGGVNSIDFCSFLDPCGRLDFLITNGHKYASSSSSIRNQFNLLDSIENRVISPLNDSLKLIDENLQNALRSYLKTYNKLKQVDSIRYQVERIKMKRNRAIIAIRSAAKTYNETEELIPVRFKIKGNIPDSLFKVNWDECKIFMNRAKRANITFYKHGNKLKYSGVKAISAKLKENKTKPYQAYKQYKKRLKTRLAHVDTLTKNYKDLLQVYDSIDANKTKLKDSIYSYGRVLSNLKTNEFNCLFELSKPSFTVLEKEMTFEKWIDFFDANRPFMLNRYDSIQAANPESYAICKEIYNSRRTIQAIKIIKSLPISDKGNETRDTVVVELVLEELGLYNVAKPQSLREFGMNKIPVNKLKVDNYSLQGNPVDIISVYLMKESWNGIYLIDGRYIFSPYAIPEEFRTATILALDVNGNHYLTKLNDQFTGQLELTKIESIEELEIFR